jgi:protocatechuate 3,4-dioxygenase beta subunit
MSVPEMRIARGVGRENQVVEALVRALHGVLVEHTVQEPELAAALAFLSEVVRTGELPMLADVLGVSILVDANSAPGAPGATPSSLEGPLYRSGAPLRPPAAALGDDAGGTPLIVSGRVTQAGSGVPLAGAELDFWQTDHCGRYAEEDPDQPEWNFRGRLRAGAGGAYELRTVVPGAYRIPHDGPTGRLLALLGREPWRPAHLHLKATAEGCRPLTTLVYFAGSDHLDDDVVFSVRDELTVELEWSADRSSAGCHLDLVLSPQGEG